MHKDKVLMFMVVATEAVFFTLLILAYLYFHANSGEGAKQTALLDPLRTFYFSMFLFTSSFTVWRAEKNVDKKNFGRSRFWLLVTILFGVTFLVGQGIEWTGLIRHGETVSTNLFGTTFFTLTGFHGMHVFVGLIVLSILLGISMLGDFQQPRTANSVGVVAIYWHFVDIVWVFIFSLVYLQVLS